MNLFLYLNRNTWVHRLDPRTKMIGALLSFIYCLCFNHPLYMGVITLLVIALALAAKALLNFWRLRFLLILLFFFSALMWSFFAKGPTLLWAWQGIQISKESLYYAVAMGLRLTTFVAIGIIFLSTTKNEEFTNGLIRLGLPYAIAFAFSTALRLIPTFVGAGATIIQAQVARGLDLEGGNILSRFRKFIPQAVPLFVYAIRHTNLLAMALESKGFSPEAKRSLYYEPQMKKIDYICIFSMTAALILMIYLRLVLNLGAVIPERI